MNVNNRIETLLMALALGPLILFHGIAENGFCDCGNKTLISWRKNKKGEWVEGRHQPGKHPYFREWGKTATTDPAQIREWLAKYPCAGLAVATGITSVVLDLDVRDNKNGILELETLSQQAGQQVPKTVTVISGSGATHLYFKIPAELERLQTPRGTKGIDFQGKGKAAIVPGSRHINGQYYQFAPGLSPVHVELANLPEWLLASMMKVPTTTASPTRTTLTFDSEDSFFATLIAEGPPASMRTPGRLRTDEAVLWKMKKVPMRRYPDDRSHSDAHWAWTLVRACSHHWPQYIRLWVHSAIRKLPDTKCGNQSYERSIITQAYSAQDQQWKSKTPQRPLDKCANTPFVALLRKQKATQREHARSPITKAVLTLHQEFPALDDRTIADTLNGLGTLEKEVTRNNVKRIRHSYKYLW